MWVFLLGALVGALDVYSSGKKVVKDDRLMNEWASNSELSFCQAAESFYESSEISQRAFDISADQNTDVKIKVSSNSKNVLVEASAEYIEINEFYLYTLIVAYTCLKDESAGVNLQLRYNDKRIDIEFVKICGNPSLFDWSSLVVMIVATGAVVISAYLSRKLKKSEVGLIEFAKKINFIYIGVLSGLEILVYLGLNKMADIIETAVILVSLISMAYIFSDISKRFSWSRDIEIPVLRRVKNTEILSIFISSCITILFISSKHWILNNFICLCLTFFIISSHQASNMKISVGLLAAMFIYCLFWQESLPGPFGQPSVITGSSQIELPINLLIPTFAKYPLTDQCMTIGISNMIIPGFLLSFGAFQDKINNSSSKYLALLATGYFFCLFLRTTTMVIYSTQFPIFLFSSPTLLALVLVYSYYRKETAELWNGRKNKSIIVNELAMKEFT